MLGFLFFYFHAILLTTKMDDIIPTIPYNNNKCRQPVSRVYYVNCDLCNGDGCRFCSGVHSIPCLDDVSDGYSSSDTSGSSTVGDSGEIDDVDDRVSDNTMHCDDADDENDHHYGRASTDSDEGSRQNEKNDDNKTKQNMKLKIKLTPPIKFTPGDNRSKSNKELKENILLRSIGVKFTGDEDCSSENRFKLCSKQEDVLTLSPNGNTVISLTELDKTKIIPKVVCDESESISSDAGDVDSIMRSVSQDSEQISMADDGEYKEKDRLSVGDRVGVMIRSVSEPGVYEACGWRGSAVYSDGDSGSGHDDRDARNGTEVSHGAEGKDGDDQGVSSSSSSRFRRRGGFMNRSHSPSSGTGLMRKAAVRRKGYNWTSKTMPKQGSCGITVDSYVRKGASLGKRSSLELAPSLLNIYDGIASSSAIVPEDGQQQHASSSPQSSTMSPPSSLYIPQHRTSGKSTPASSSPCSPNSPPTLSRVPYRSGKLPSLSQPMDRPVSLMDTDPCSTNSTHHDGNAAVDSKKRPLSISSASTLSTSSLPRVRKLRQSRNTCRCNKNESESSSKTGCNCNSVLSPNGDARCGLNCSGTVSESHSSMDGSRVQNDHNGNRCFDDMSITSSSETGSFRDDMSSGIHDFVDTSQNSLDSCYHSISTSHADGVENNGDDGYGSSVQMRPKPSSEESDIMKRMCSYIVRSSTPRIRTSSNQSDLGSGLNSPEERKRLDSISRNEEARKQFFSNYEERYTKLYMSSSSKDNEPDYEELNESAAAPSSPSLSANDSSLVAAAEEANVDQTASNGAVDPMLSSETIVSSTATTVSSSPPASPSTSSSFTSNTSHKRTPSSRASRKRDVNKSGEASFTPSGPVYVTYVQRVVAEIVESERMYISSLEDIIYGYLEPLEGMLNMEAAKDDIVCLFSNIREIYDFGKVFLADLEETDGDPIKVAECFVRHNKGFVIYTQYCTNYPCAVEVLTRFMLHSELSELCKERQIALGHGLPLGAYLLKPVQRVLKYHLLLQNIVKSYEKENKEVPVLKQAFQHMTEMAHHINEMKRKHEHAVRIQEIQSQLEDYSGEDLTRLGELVLESTFRIYGAKASRQVFLFERGLLISKKKDGGMLSCKTFIKCSNLMLVEVIPNEPLSFHAIPFNNPRAQYTLQARNMEQKRRWCQEMKRLILESFKGQIPENVKCLVMELGREHDDDYVTKESLDAVRKHQHTAPEYLEKRRVRRKSGSRMPDFSLLKPNKAKRNGQRKEEKTGNRGFLELGGRRAESKSPETHRKIFSKFMIPQARSQSHSLPNSLPNTPITENTSLSETLQAPDNRMRLTISQPSSPNQMPDSTVLPTTTTSLSSAISDLNRNSDFHNKSRTLPSPIKLHKNNTELSAQALRNQSFRAAMNSQPLASPDFNSRNIQHGVEANISDINTRILETRDQERRNTSNNKNDRKRESLYEEDDDYVTIKQDDSVSDYQQLSTNGNVHCDHNTPKTNNNINVQSVKHSSVETCDSKSSSLPSLIDDNKGAGGNASVNNHCQSSDNINHAYMPKGRMSRRDLQDALGGRHSRKKNTPKTLETKASDEKINSEGSLVRTKALRIPNTSQYFSIPESKLNQHKESGKACLTNWNNVEKLTKGSMTDLSHIHEDLWEVNSLPSVSVDNVSNLSPAKDINSSTSNGFSSLQNLTYNSSDGDESLKNKDNLDWLVYLKRNHLDNVAVSLMNQTKRMSASILEGGGTSQEFLGVKKRSSAHNSPYATPPRFYMTQDNMKRFGQSPPNLRSSTDVYHDYRYPSPNSLSNESHGDQSDINGLPRWQSTPNTSECSGVVKLERPFSLDFDKSPDENQLRDESNRIVAEMEEYINKTPTPETIKSFNKFPTTLSTIVVDGNGKEENTQDDKRLSTVSSMSTSSYESTSSEGIAGTMKLKPHQWTGHMTKTNEENEHNLSYNSILSSDEDDNIKEHERMSTSPSKLKNAYAPPLDIKKSWQEERKLETVLRERSLGSESLGSRMAHTVPWPEPSKSMPQLQNLPTLATDTRNSHHNENKTEHYFPNETIFPDNSRFSMPTSKEAAEALMTLSLDSCDIQQSDSGFSLQSNDSTLSDGGENIKSPSTDIQSNESPYKAKMSVELKPKQQEKGNETQQKRSRHNSTESVDSTDSFYERRLSLVLNEEELKDKLTIVKVYDDTPNSSLPVSPKPPKKSIREVVQMLEDNTKPKSHQVFEVRKREPGAIIRERLESLRKNVSYGRSKTCDPISTRHRSEEREFIRSKSQPPSQYRKVVRDGIVNKPKCNDDIKIKNTSVSMYGNNELPRSRERVNSLSKSKEKINSLSKSNGLSNISRSKEGLNLSKSKENLSLSRSKDSVHVYGLSLPRPSTPSNAYHSNRPGHEMDWMRYQGNDDEDIENGNTNNQFVYRVKQDSGHQKENVPISQSDQSQKANETDSHSELEDQQSSEVDNLVIMKGWVKALISKFQDK